VFFLISLAVTVPVLARLQELNGPLQNGIAAQGVVSLELARTLERQSEVLGSWTEPDLLRLAFSIGLDFLCAVAFIATTTMACVWLAEKSGSGAAFRAKCGRALVYCLLTLGIFWTLQNVLLAEVVFGYRTAITAEVIYWCALWKFTVMGVSTAYLLLSGGILLVTGFSRR